MTIKFTKENADDYRAQVGDKFRWESNLFVCRADDGSIAFFIFAGWSRLGGRFVQRLLELGEIEITREVPDEPFVTLVTQYPVLEDKLAILLPQDRFTPGQRVRVTIEPIEEKKG